MSRHHKKVGWSGEYVKAFRTLWKHRMLKAEGLGKPYVCPRCNRVVLSTEDWDVGLALDLNEGGNHFDVNNQRPEHSSCNRRAGAHVTNQIKREKNARIRKWL